MMRSKAQSVTAAMAIDTRSRAFAAGASAPGSALEDARRCALGACLGPGTWEEDGGDWTPRFTLGGEGLDGG